MRRSAMDNLRGRGWVDDPVHYYLRRGDQRLSHAAIRQIERGRALPPPEHDQPVPWPTSAYEALEQAAEARRSK